ncbi:MAG: hypothetical protein P4L90_15590 [Rhodopila sp.]|nr:hypothetical protein [Rhodopila sp.]
MRHYRSTTQSLYQARPRAAAAVAAEAAAADEQQSMMRGLVHGIILSLAMWVAAGYAAIILR